MESQVLIRRLSGEPHPLNRRINYRNSLQEERVKDEWDQISQKSLSFLIAFYKGLDGNCSSTGLLPRLNNLSLE